MNAFQPSRPPLQPVEARRVAPQARRRRYSHAAMTLETAAKLSVNIILSVLAAYALLRLIPYTCSQQKKLQEIQTEDRQIEGHVAHLQTDFSRFFDPHQTQNIMQEQSDRLAPGERPVVLLKPDAKGAEMTRGARN
ncbi:MAG: hypothetical protein JOZ78_05740 [Chroococcidiopsidaceae cyanobacterium CP_BM_ER_R8_30]|nr:hypothetical protein [Chroococcidiopsidaceae cyanobacterium CP_BM_ER_R8_30]